MLLFRDLIWRVPWRLQLSALRATIFASAPALIISRNASGHWHIFSPDECGEFIEEILF
jgi:hypothetical protein